MSTPRKPPRLSPKTKDILWHIGKTLLCLGQFCAASVLAAAMAAALEESFLFADQPWLILLLAFVIQLIDFYALWHYYDEIDDRSFNRFCESEEAPVLFRDPAYLVGFVLTILGGGLFVLTLCPLLCQCLPMCPSPVWAAVSVAVGMAIAGGVSVYRLREMQYVWSIQKGLRRPTDKPVPLWKRILYAAIFGVAVLLATALGVVFAPLLLHFLFSMVLISWEFLVGLLCGILLLLGILLLRRVLDRRAFFKRLEKLRERGELSFTVHGHPYLSLLSRRVPFGLTIVDVPHRESRSKETVTYQIAVANCGRRLRTVVLCEDNVFQFMHAFRLRLVGHVGMLGMGGKIISMPLGAWFTSHSFDFPEGDGKRILLVDPAPHTLCMRGFREGELISLDNGSEQFGYAVYGKNSFLNLLERI